MIIERKLLVILLSLQNVRYGTTPHHMPWVLWSLLKCFTRPCVSSVFNHRVDSVIESLLQNYETFGRKIMQSNWVQNLCSVWTPYNKYLLYDLIYHFSLPLQVSSLRGAGSTPLQLVSYWKCEDDVTELRVDYRYNPGALPSPAQPLLNVTLSAVVDGLVKAMHSKPQGQWWGIPHNHNKVNNNDKIKLYLLKWVTQAHARKARYLQNCPETQSVAPPKTGQQVLGSNQRLPPSLKPIQHADIKCYASNIIIHTYRQGTSCGLRCPTLWNFILIWMSCDSR